MTRRAGGRARARGARRAARLGGARLRGPRRAILRRAQKWLVDNSERVIETIVSETGKTYEDALSSPRSSYGANAFGFWAKHAPEVPRRRARQDRRRRCVKGKKLVLRYRPLGLVGVIGPWNYPLTNSFGDCIPALAAGNAVILKPQRGHAADDAC